MLLFYLSCVICRFTGVLVLGQEQVTVNAGDGVKLPCKLIKNEDLTRITWQRRTKALAVDTTFFFITPDDKIKVNGDLTGRVEFLGRIPDRDGAIRLMNVTYSDQGVYTCIFSFFPSGPFTKRLSLDVQVPPVVTVAPDKIPVAGQPEDIIAACAASGAKPEAEVSWSLGDLSASLRVQTNTSANPDGTFTTISYLWGVPSKRLNQKSVVCSVTHPALKEGLQREYTIDVHYPPQVVHIRPVGDPTAPQEFVCEADANPKVSEFTWSRNFPVTEILTRSSSLFINRTSKSNGLYFCVVSNQYNSAVGSFYVQYLDTQESKSGWILFALTLLALIAFVVYLYHQKRPQCRPFASLPTNEPPTSDQAF